MLFSVNHFEKRNVSGISLHSTAFLFSLTQTANPATIKDFNQKQNCRAS